MAIPLNLPKSNNIIGLWHLDENLLDSSSTGNNGTGSNVSYTGGRINQCASFNGSSSEITTTTQYNNPVTYSMVCAIKSTATDRSFINFAAPQTGTPSSFDRTLAVSSGGKLNFYWYDGGERNLTGNITINTGNWVVVGVTVESGTVRLYVNGNYDVQTSANLGNFSGWWRFGRKYTDWYNGLLDEVLLWNVKLTDNEMYQAYSALSGYIYAKNVAIGSPMIFMRDIYDNNKKLWQGKKLILPKDLGFSY